MTHRLSPRVEGDLDDIWLYVAQASGSIEIANRLIDTITDRFLVLSRFPFLGRSREELGAGYRSLTVGEWVIVYCLENDEALVLRVVHGRRQIESLFGV